VFKKMLPWVLMILVVIALIVTAAFLLWEKLFTEPTNSDSDRAQSSVESVEGAKLPAAKVKALSTEIKDVLTNLSSGDFIKISFTFVLSNENGKEEFELLDFKIRHIINLTLADLSPEEIKGSQGNDFVSSTIMNKINQVLEEGKVREVNITSLVIS
jgi:flagellar FliL protein